MAHQIVEMAFGDRRCRRRLATLRGENKPLRQLPPEGFRVNVIDRRNAREGSRSVDGKSEDC